MCGHNRVAIWPTKTFFIRCRGVARSPTLSRKRAGGRMHCHALEASSYFGRSTRRRLSCWTSGGHRPIQRCDLERLVQTLHAQKRGDHAGRSIVNAWNASSSHRSKTRLLMPRPPKAVGLSSGLPPRWGDGFARQISGLVGEENGGRGKD